MSPLDLAALEARLQAPRPDPNTPEFWRWLMELREDHRSLIREVRDLRDVVGSLQQEGSGRLPYD